MQSSLTRIPPGHTIPAIPECRRRGASSRSPSGKSRLRQRAGRSRLCFPTSLCDLIGILAQALARVMGPGVPETRPPPQEFASGSTVLRQSEPRRGSGRLYLLCARSLQLPPVATAARSPGTAPPAAGSTPRHPCPARHALASTIPGARDSSRSCSHTAGSIPAPTPGLGTPPTLEGQPLGGACPRRT